MIESSSVCLRLQQVGLKATVGNHFILQNISSDVLWGDRLALVGASGSGKTSLLRLLNRLSEPTEGSIYFEAQEIRQIPVLQLRQQITLVPQESRLLGMTVREALSYPLLLRGLPRQTIQQRLMTWTEYLHIPQDWFDRTEVQLSVGQRQLVAIARALMIQPKILLLDEPTSALDAGRGDNLIKVLNHLASNQQIAIVMVSHQLDIAKAFCNQVLHLHQGRMLSNRPADQVDWTELKQHLIAAEAKEAEEWLE